MHIERYHWAQESDAVRRKVLMRATQDISEQMETAAMICADVRIRGDAAVVEYTERFDGVKLSAHALRVAPEAFARAKSLLPSSVQEAIAYAAGNIRRFHSAQKPPEMWMMEVDQGITAGEKVTAIPDVALYVPRGKGSFPSVLLMLGTPAVVAGVQRIVVLTPPNEEGGVDPAILYAADLLGLTEVYCVGGAQAVAAVAYGTESIPKCAKIIGPGNPYVTAAKRYVAGVIDPGVPAGPSEAIILADAQADPRKVAQDLLIEAEHGPDSAALLVTHSEALADAVEGYVQDFVKSLSSDVRRAYIETVMQRYGGIVLTESLAQSVDFVNAYAPEHMEVLVEQPFALLPSLHHAGELLLGEWTPITLCNFMLGTNAILPTGGAARTVSAVSLQDFQKRTSIGYATKEGFLRVQEKAAVFAEWEGFEAHAKAVRDRL
ncbi:MAG: histidinol dehydrogenase [Firmicutes bacterium]|nr:histidinol dehydrogenase [Bacillota bacterium]